MGTIKELRARSGLSQAKFAELYHFKVDTLRKWEYRINKTPEHVLYMLSRLVDIDFPEESHILYTEEDRLRVTESTI